MKPDPIYKNRTKILESIRASGYLMEQEVATVFESLGFSTQTAFAYTDQDEGVSREIDVWAFKHIFPNSNPLIQINVHILCECKNNSAPFVFLDRPKNALDRSHRPEEYVFPVDPNNASRINTFKHLGLERVHHYYSQDWKAVQFCKVVRDKDKLVANHEGIYDGILIPIIKAFVSTRQQALTMTQLRAQHILWLFFQLVVLNGPIYYLDCCAKNMKLKTIHHIPYMREIMSKTIRGSFLVDFVRQSALNNFFANCINPFVGHIAQLAERSPHEFFL